MIRPGRECYVKIEAEIGILLPEALGHLESPETESGKGRFSPRNF